MSGALYHDGRPSPELGPVQPGDHVAQWLKDGQFGGAYLLGQGHQLRAGQDRHVLAVAAPQALRLVQAERVAVTPHTQRVDGGRFAIGDDVDSHPVPGGHPQVGIVGQGVNPAHNLVAGNGR